MYETIRFYAVGTALVVAGVVAGILFGGILAALIVPLHLEGTLASISGVLTLAAFFGPVLIVPIVGIRRLRLRLPPDDPEPPTQRPARRSDAAIRADVQRLDARLDPERSTTSRTRSQES
jgi:hypothetical protein